MRRSAALLLTLFVASPAGCGGKRSDVISGAPEAPPTVISSNTGAEVRLSSDVRSIEQTLAAPTATVWSALATVWQDLGIPLTHVDAPNAVLRSDRFRAPSTVGRRPIREFVDCGYSLAGARVDLWEVNLDVTTALRPDNQGTRVATVVAGTARPRDGTSTNAVPCASIGGLERLIIQRLRELLKV